MMYSIKRYLADKRRLRVRMSGLCRNWTGYACLLLVALAGLVMLFAIGTAAAETAYVAVTTGTLNLRYAPHMGDNVEYRLDRGDELELLAISDGWATVVYGGDTLYCRAEYLSTEEPGDTAAAYTVTGSGRVRVRTSPGGEATGRYVRPGEAVTVTGWLDGWAYIGDGWVDASYLEGTK